jgi:hypothetical protein
MTMKKSARTQRMERENKLYENYIKHLPSVPPGEAIKSGQLLHLVVHHDDWCAFYDGQACNCNPTYSIHTEPKRS